MSCEKRTWQTLPRDGHVARTDTNHCTRTPCLPRWLPCGPHLPPTDRRHRFRPSASRGIPHRTVFHGAVGSRAAWYLAARDWLLCVRLQRLALRVSCVACPGAGSCHNSRCNHKPGTLLCELHATSSPSPELEAKTDAEEEAAAKKKAEEEAAANKKAEEEAAADKKAEESAAHNNSEEDGSKRRASSSHDAGSTNSAAMKGTLAKQLKHIGLDSDKIAQLTAAADVKAHERAAKKAEEEAVADQKAHDEDRKHGTSASHGAGAAGSAAGKGTHHHAQLLHAKARLEFTVRACVRPCAEAESAAVAAEQAVEQLVRCAVLFEWKKHARENVKATESCGGWAGPPTVLTSRWRCGMGRRGGGGGGAEGIGKGGHRIGAGFEPGSLGFGWTMRALADERP